MTNAAKMALAIGFSALSLAACETFSPGAFGDSPDVNYAAGSPVGAGLSDRDAALHAGIFLAAIETGAEDNAQRWSGVSASGVVTPGGFALANLKSNPDIRIPARRGLDLSHMLETELGLYVLKRNANIRTGPSTDRRVRETLDAGAGVEAVGKVPGQPWYLIAKDQVIRGYVHESLVVKAPGTELELAGGPQRRPVLCRNFIQRISLNGAIDEWRGAACLKDARWHLAPEAPEADDGLIGL